MWKAVLAGGSSLPWGVGGAALIRGLQQEAHGAVGTGALLEHHHRVALQGHLCVFPDKEHSCLSLCPAQQWGRGRVQVSWLGPRSSGGGQLPPIHVAHMPLGQCRETPEICHGPWGRLKPKPGPSHQPGIWLPVSPSPLPLEDRGRTRGHDTADWEDTVSGPGSPPPNEMTIRPFQSLSSRRRCWLRGDQHKLWTRALWASTWGLPLSVWPRGRLLNFSLCLTCLSVKCGIEISTSYISVSVTEEREA